MRLVILSLSLALSLTSHVWADQETLLEKADGNHGTVRTDESGTTIEALKSVRTEPVSPAEKQHWGKVFELTKEGGRILSHRANVRSTDGR